MQWNTQDLEAMSVDELNAMQSGIQAALRKKATLEKRKARERIRELAALHEIDLAELAATNSRVSAPYRNPDNQFETWSGRGRKPTWLVELLAAGRTLEDLHEAST